MAHCLHIPLFVEDFACFCKSSYIILPMHPIPTSTLWAGGFIYHPFRKKVLLHLRDHNTTYNPGKYAFFWGTAENGETARQCCSREWEEELGLLISPKKLSPLKEYILPSGVIRSSFYLTLPLDMADIEVMEWSWARWVWFDELELIPCAKQCYQDLMFFREILSHQK